MRPIVACLLLVAPTCLGAAEPIKAAQGSLFQPANAPSLGKLSAGAGATVTFNTGSDGVEPAVSGAATGKGVLGLSASGKVQVAVFAFDSISLDEGAKIEITGDRALVLVAKGAIALDTTLSVAGGPGTKWDRSKGDASGAGGPGGEGGEYGKAVNSAPPPADGGNGGPAMKDNGKPGRGVGAGFNQRVKGAAGGGGGAYGGNGGETSEGSEGGGVRTPRPMPGGKSYGDDALADLFGGSGGAGASNDRAFTSAGGGGGGGAVALVSLVSITIGPKGQVLAPGGAGGSDKGCGGGGSGGGILLAAPTLVLKPGAVVDASGGAGGSTPGAADDIKLGKGRRQHVSGGGGGGGRIACYSNDDLGAPGKDKTEAAAPKGFNLAGGKGGAEAKDGAPGTFFDGKWRTLR